MKTKSVLVALFLSACVVFSAGQLWAAGGPPKATGPSSDWAAFDIKRGWVEYDEESATYKLNINGNGNVFWTLDFGPEFYTPYPCLNSIFSLFFSDPAFTPQVEECLHPGGDDTSFIEFTHEIGIWTIGTFRCNCESNKYFNMDTGTCKQGRMRVKANLPDYMDYLQEEEISVPRWISNLETKIWAKLPEDRPRERWVTAWGRLGESARTLIVWEIAYGSTNVDIEPISDRYLNDKGVYDWQWWRGVGEPWMKRIDLMCTPTGGEGEE